MKTLIVYASKTGSTEKCAGIIGQNLKDATIINLSARQNEDVNKYDKIIIGTPIRMGMIHKKVKEFINKNVEILKNKKVAENYKQYFEQNISKELLEKAITYDTFGGEMILEKQKGFDKFIVKMVSKNIAQNKEIKILTENIDRFIEKVK